MISSLYNKFFAKETESFDEQPVRSLSDTQQDSKRERRNIKGNIMPTLKHATRRLKTDMPIVFWFWFWFINQQDSLTNMFTDVFHVKGETSQDNVKNADIYYSVVQ